MEEEKQSKQSKRDQFIKLALPVSIIVSAVMLVVSNYYSTLILTLKLDRIENRLTVGESQEIIPVRTDKDSPYLGNSNAKVTVIEYADFQCPFCKEFQVKVFPRIKEKFIDTGKIKFIYQHHPFLGEESFMAAEASECAKDQGKFWEYHDLIFAKQTGENIGDFTTEKLKQYGKDLNLNTETFNKCLDDRKYKDRVNNQVLLGSDYGVNSTPTIFINGKKFEGVTPLYKLEQAIEANE